MGLYSNIRICYYSGTGGTAMAAGYFQRELLESGRQCTMETITDGTCAAQDTHDLLVLLFPVHAFNAPEAVYRWIEHLNSVKDTPAVVISVSGGGEVFPNTACRAGSIRRLQRKGYHIMYESMLVMPSNWVVATKEPLASMLVRVLPDKVHLTVTEILSGTCKRSSPLWIDRLFSQLGKIETYGAGLWGRFIRVRSTCTACGRCVKNCPAKNIVFENSKPRFGGKCHMCMKCIYLCPVHALTPGVCRFFMLKDGYDLESLSKTALLCPPVKTKTLTGSALWAGVSKYLDE
jgi:ferredoxin